MKEHMHYANEELKRAEHLLYVSLKYTRTADIIKSLVDRLISCFDYLINGLLEQKESKGEISEIPKSPFAKIELLKEIYKDNKEMIEYLEFYILLRKIARCEYYTSNEFRRNVTFFGKIDDKTIEINIDISGDYFHKTVEFLRFIKENFLEE